MSSRVNQCSKPSGWLGRSTLWRMNASHSNLTDWGLQHVSIANHYTILDVGCGGGRTVSKLAAMATQGKVYGVDYSEESVAATKRERTRTGSNSAALKCGTAPFPSCRLSLMTDGKRSILFYKLPGNMQELQGELALAPTKALRLESLSF
ncbi:MAG: hypothetical protein DMG38_06150 [Acidobacteria bacterium]|nr:MAG: hypothetical protein DMG38_06150 [Acidobacteriota bacterium]